MLRRPAVRLGFFMVCLVLLGSFISAIVTEKTIFLYKDALQLSASQITTLNLFLNIPVYLQPLLAGRTEMVPWRGYRRRPYYALGILLAVGSYACLSLLKHYTYLPVVALVLNAVVGSTLRSVVISAFFISVGNRTGSTSKIQNLILFLGLVLQIGVTSHLGGYVAEHWSYSRTFLTTAGLLLLYLPMIFLVEDPRIAHPEQQKQGQQETRQALRAAVKDRRLWGAIAFIAYLALTPSPDTALIFYQTDALHFSKQLIGDLNRFLAIGQAIGFFACLIVARWLPLRWVCVAICFLNMGLYGGYLIMTSVTTAQIGFITRGVVSSLLGILNITLLSRSCTKGIEGTVFGMFASVNAFFYLICDKWGSWLYDYYGPANHGTVLHGWYMSNFIGLAVAAGAFVFLPFLPAWTKSRATLSSPLEET